jgi:hypothetical protein
MNPITFTITPIFMTAAVVIIIIASIFNMVRMQWKILELEQKVKNQKEAIHLTLGERKQYHPDYIRACIEKYVDKAFEEQKNKTAHDTKA